MGWECSVGVEARSGGVDGEYCNYLVPPPPPSSPCRLTLPLALSAAPISPPFVIGGWGVRVRVRVRAMDRTHTHTLCLSPSYLYTHTVYIHSNPLDTPHPTPPLLTPPWPPHNRPRPSPPAASPDISTRALQKVQSRRLPGSRVSRGVTVTVTAWKRKRKGKDGWRSMRCLREGCHPPND